jgi:hypothetical protein
MALSSPVLADFILADNLGEQIAEAGLESPGMRRIEANLRKILAPDLLG